MQWRDLAGAATEKGDGVTGCKEEPQAVHIHRVLEEFCLNMSLSSKELQTHL